MSAFCGALGWLDRPGVPAMISYPQRAWERAMKVEEVILRAVSKQITFWEAVRILRYSPRHALTLRAL
jgi:hypothetical protein